MRPRQTDRPGKMMDVETLRRWRKVTGTRSGASTFIKGFKARLSRRKNKQELKDV